MNLDWFVPRPSPQKVPSFVPGQSPICNFSFFSPFWLAALFFALLFCTFPFFYLIEKQKKKIGMGLPCRFSKEKKKKNLNNKNRIEYLYISTTKRIYHYCFCKNLVDVSKLLHSLWRESFMS